MFYKEYNTPDNWRDVAYDAGYDCQKCEDLQYKLEEARQYLSSLVKQIYSKEPLNPIEVERDLDELCHLLHVKEGQGQPNIQRTPERSLNAWINFNQECLTKIAL